MEVQEGDGGQFERRPPFPAIQPAGGGRRTGRDGRSARHLEPRGSRVRRRTPGSQTTYGGCPGWYQVALLFPGLSRRRSRFGAAFFLRNPTGLHPGLARCRVEVTSLGAPPLRKEADMPLARAHGLLAATIDALLASPTATQLFPGPKIAMHLQEDSPSALSRYRMESPAGRPPRSRESRTGP